MKIYTYYSDFNGKYKRNIPRDIQDSLDQGGALPKEYRRSPHDIFISGIDSFAPNMYGWTSAQIWWSAHNQRWTLHFWRNSSILKICAEKYYDTINLVNKFPDYMALACNYYVWFFG